jgi:predicted RNA-binding protein with PUA domain
MSIPDVNLTACQNCDAPLSTAYCPVCGQRAAEAQLSLRSMGRDFFERVMQVETRLLHTVWGLLRAPQTT